MKFKERLLNLLKIFFSIAILYHNNIQNTDVNYLPQHFNHRILIEIH